MTVLSSLFLANGGAVPNKVDPSPVLISLLASLHYVCYINIQPFSFGVGGGEREA